MICSVKPFCITGNVNIIFTYFKYNLGEYDETTGKLLNNTKDLRCADSNDFGTNVAWTNLSWADGNITYLNKNPPIKDTIVVPTGKANNLFCFDMTPLSKLTNKVKLLYQFM